MKSEELEAVRGSGNVFRDLGSGDAFRDLGYENADAEQLKAVIAAADFSRIRTAGLGRFTVDRLMSIINRLGSRVEVKVKLYRRQPTDERVLA
ncbi:MAG: XRE family transcriptional regulator [Bryobacteraceae bacterium]|jgi:hypothetical protein